MAARAGVEPGPEEDGVPLLRVAVTAHDLTEGRHRPAAGVLGHWEHPERLFAEASLEGEAGVQDRGRLDNQITGKLAGLRHVENPPRSTLDQASFTQQDGSH